MLKRYLAGVIECVLIALSFVAFVIIAACFFHAFLRFMGGPL